MPITGRRQPGGLRLALALAVFLTLAARPAAPQPGTSAQPWFGVVATLASALSRNDATAAMDAFDGHAKSRDVIETNLGALIAQTEILCAIDVVEDTEAGGAHGMDVDWYMQLKSRADNGPTERRRERIHLTVGQIKGQWKILELSPLTILNPLTIP